MTVKKIRIYQPMGAQSQKMRETRLLAVDIRGRSLHHPPPLPYSSVGRSIGVHATGMRGISYSTWHTCGTDVPQTTVPSRNYSMGEIENSPDFFSPNAYIRRLSKACVRLLLQG